MILKHTEIRTEETEKKLLNYCATRPNPTIRFQWSKMALRVHRDASYLSAPKSRSRLGGHFLLFNYSDASKPNMHNGKLLVIASMIKHVLSSSAEAEMSALFIIMKDAEVIIHFLKDMLCL